MQDDMNTCQMMTGVKTLDEVCTDTTQIKLGD